MEETVQCEDEYARAKELAKRKIKSYQKDRKDAQYRKLSGYLLRKGYSYDIVSKVVKELIDVQIKICYIKYTK